MMTASSNPNLKNVEKAAKVKNCGFAFAVDSIPNDYQK
jgi:hypothetical protein